MITSRTHLTSLLVASMLVSCAPERPSDTNLSDASELNLGGADAVVVATVQNRDVTRGAFERELGDLEPWAARRYVSKETRVDLLNAMVVMLVLAHHAELEGMLDDPRVTDALRDELARDVLERALLEQGADTISDDALRAAYDASPPEAMTQPLRRGIIMAGGKREVVEGWRAEIMEAEDRAATMSAIAKASSLLPNRTTGGTIDFTPPPGVESSDPAVIDALFALSAPGDVSDVVVSGDFFWLVMFQEERAPTKQPLAQVSEALRTKLRREQRQNTRRALIEELRAGTTIEIFPEALAKAKAPK